MTRLASIGAALLLLFAFAGTVSGHNAQTRCETLVLTEATGLTVDIYSGTTLVLDNANGVATYHVGAGVFRLVWSDGYTIQAIVVGACEQPTPPNLPCEQTGAPCLVATPTPTPAASQPVATPSPTPAATPTPPEPTPGITGPPGLDLTPPPTDRAAASAGTSSSDGVWIAFALLAGIAGAAVVVRRQGERA